jgi:hypothetical protein
MREIRVQGSRFKVQGSRFKVQGSRFRVQGSGFRVQGSRFKVQGSGFRLTKKFLQRNGGPEHPCRASDVRSNEAQLLQRET